MMDEHPDSQQPVIRRARLDEVNVLDTLIAASARGLGAGHYTPAQTEAALGSAFGVDTQLIEDGTYFLALFGDKPAACGGWSYRETLFGSDRQTGRSAGIIDPATGAARIRAFFVHPQFARQGIATLLLSHCESEAAARGYRRLQLMSTLPGLGFYSRRGYQPEAAIEHELPGGVRITFVPMFKHLAR